MMSQRTSQSSPWERVTSWSLPGTGVQVHVHAFAKSATKEQKFKWDAEHYGVNDGERYFLADHERKKPKANHLCFL